MLLENKKLATISGGGTTKWFVLGGIVSFIAGLFTGFFNPKSCNR